MWFPFFRIQVQPHAVCYYRQVQMLIARDLSRSTYEFCKIATGRKWATLEKQKGESRVNSHLVGNVQSALKENVFPRSLFKMEICFFPCPTSFLSERSEINLIFFLFQTSQKHVAIAGEGRYGRSFFNSLVFPSLARVCWSVKRCACYTWKCNDMLNKPEALHYGQSEHPEPKITVCLGLCEGRGFICMKGHLWNPTLHAWIQHRLCAAEIAGRECYCGVSSDMNGCQQICLAAVVTLKWNWTLKHHHPNWNSTAV